MNTFPKLAVVAAIDCYPYKGAKHDIHPKIPAASCKIAKMSPSTPAMHDMYRVDKDYMRLLSLRSQTTLVNNTKQPIYNHQKQSSRQLPNRWDNYPWHGFYRDGSSVQGSVNKLCGDHGHRVQHRTLSVTKERQGNSVKMERKPDGKPNNSIRKSVMMSRRAVPLQIIETAII